MVTFLLTLMGLTATFLIILVLIQRGRGGGLAGALGGAGGQSAFGSKAGDMFTRITIVAAGVWILLCILTTWWVSEHSGSQLQAGEADSSVTAGSNDQGTGESKAGTDGATGTGGTPPTDTNK